MWTLLRWWTRHPALATFGVYLAGVALILLTAGGATDRFATGDRAYDRVSGVVIYTLVCGTAWVLLRRRARRR